MKIKQLICESRIDNSFVHLHTLLKDVGSTDYDDFVELVNFVSDLRDEYDNDGYHTIMEVSKHTQQINKNFLMSLFTCVRLYTKGKSYNVKALYKNTKIFDNLSKVQIESCCDFIDNLEKLDDNVLQDMAKRLKNVPLLLTLDIDDIAFLTHSLFPYNAYDLTLLSKIVHKYISKQNKIDHVMDLFLELEENCFNDAI